MGTGKNKNSRAINLHIQHSNSVRKCVIKKSRRTWLKHLIFEHDNLTNVYTFAALPYKAKSHFWWQLWLCFVSYIKLTRWAYRLWLLQLLPKLFCWTAKRLATGTMTSMEWNVFRPSGEWRCLDSMTRLLNAVKPVLRSGDTRVVEGASCPETSARTM